MSTTTMFSCSKGKVAHAIHPRDDMTKTLATAGKRRWSISAKTLAPKDEVLKAGLNLRILEGCIRDYFTSLLTAR